MSQMNEWIRTFSEAFNDILKGGYDVKDRPGVILFSADKETDDNQYVFGHNNNLVTQKDDTYYKLTAKNASVLKALVADPDLLATKGVQSEGVDEYKNVDKLINMVNDKTVVSFRGASTAEFLTSILSDIALNTNSAKIFYNNFTNVGKAIDNQRLSISGVDQDEEAVSLVKYQNAYNLASRMIQTMTEIYDRLILQTGV